MLPPKTKRQFHKQVGSFWSWRIESISSHLVIILVKYMLAKLMKEHATKWKFHLLSNKLYGLQSPLAHIPKPLSLLTCSGSRVQVNEIWCVYICVCLYRSLYVKERMASHSIRQCLRVIEPCQMAPEEYPECTSLHLVLQKSWWFCAKEVRLVNQPSEPPPSHQRLIYIQSYWRCSFSHQWEVKDELLMAWVAWHWECWSEQGAEKVECCSTSSCPTHTGVLRLRSLGEGGICWLRCVKVVEWLGLVFVSPEVSAPLYFGGRVWHRPLTFEPGSRGGSPFVALPISSGLEGGHGSPVDWLPASSGFEGGRGKTVERLLASSGRDGGRGSAMEWLLVSSESSESETDVWLSEGLVLDGPLETIRVSSLEDGGTFWSRCVNVVEWLGLVTCASASGPPCLGGRVRQRLLALELGSRGGGPFESNSRCLDSEPVLIEWTDWFEHPEGVVGDSSWQAILDRDSEVVLRLSQVEGWGLSGRSLVDAMGSSADCSSSSSSSPLVTRSSFSSSSDWLSITPLQTGSSSDDPSSWPLMTTSLLVVVIVCDLVHFLSASSVSRRSIRSAFSLFNCSFRERGTSGINHATSILRNMAKFYNTTTHTIKHPVIFYRDILG